MARLMMRFIADDLGDILGRINVSQVMAPMLPPVLLQAITTYLDYRL